MSVISVKLEKKKLTPFSNENLHLTPFDKYFKKKWRQKRLNKYTPQIILIIKLIINRNISFLSFDVFVKKAWEIITS